MDPQQTLSRHPVMIDASARAPEPATRESRSESGETFARRHIGPSDEQINQMLEALGFQTLEDLAAAAIPESIRLRATLELPEPRSEQALLDDLRALARTNRVFRSFVGRGYSGCVTPAVIRRNILENPGWYTQYTPYQAEASQGRLEALLNFQTMVADLTGLPVAGASLLDEATAAAEAMTMCAAVAGGARRRFVVSEDCHPQTIDVVRTRARSMGLDLEVASLDSIESVAPDACGILIQFPATGGRLVDHSALIERAHERGVLVVMATDLLALTVLKPPGEWGADIAVGSTQRLGVPMGFGGPHAAFLATREAYVRKMPGRLIGVSHDAQGRTAYRMSIQTREQHIRRERATSNICTAQVLPAILASMYAVYHGPDGLRQIAERVHRWTSVLAAGLERLGLTLAHQECFDTLCVRAPGQARAVVEAARGHGINLDDQGEDAFGIALDETVGAEDVRLILQSVTEAQHATAEPPPIEALEAEVDPAVPAAFVRTSDFLTHPVFHRYRSETEMMRYVARLQSRDLSLAQSMIPLGSCTMKLNAAVEMEPISWPGFADLHPCAPAEQTGGYDVLLADLEHWLAELTGLPAVTLQPNAGSQGEYTGLLVIRAFHEQRGEAQRSVCLIPTSAHGTNPASAVMAGLTVVPVACDEHGNIDLVDLRRQAQEHHETLAALMITYPSTHGVFEERIREICQIVHEHGGQVYLDGANLNALVGLCRPSDFGADVCHVNLHKTFCIPHGGGGPGMGPIAAADHLAPFLPGHPFFRTGPAPAQAIGAVAAAPFGSPSILPISWAYIALMGAAGLRRASQVAILNANYMARRLEGHYDVLFRGERGLVAHEFIIDCRPFATSAGVRIDDIAKRLMDYGFHAPTMSWPVPGTLMIEPTESESQAELDRYCDALIQIRAEIRDIEEGRADREDNVLRNAPHTIEAVAADVWTHPYTREEAAFPADWLRDRKFWPPVGRVDNAWGDRNLFCTCPDWGSGAAPAG